MLYHHEIPFSDEKWKNPGKEYRSAPFWSWNCELTEEKLTEQIPMLKEMGFGGFFMHVRSGLSTPYMGKEHLDLVEACTAAAKKENMLAWLYDEDRWPSGFAGGLVTKEHPEYRQHFLVFTKNPVMDENTVGILARYDIELNADGTLAAYRRLNKSEKALHEERFALLKRVAPTPRFNNAGYVDVLNPKAMQEFIQVTHEKYAQRLGKDFGETVPAIFTDEPQFAQQIPLPSAFSNRDAVLAWTPDLPKTFAKTYKGEDLLASLPELFWNLPNDKPSTIRYHFHDHLCERFVSAFSGTIGKWCEKNNILFTGHVMHEESLNQQTKWVGDAMRFYRYMTLPGIDILCGSHEISTAKQAQSSARQHGRIGMMSELYGVLGWDLDFRGHKHHGDWQTAMGVSLRVPHLSLVSMQGEAKRDYPQSISYQSSWYKKYNLIEDHFARLNAVLTRGKDRVQIAVVHPIESFWTRFGSEDRNSGVCSELESNFQQITDWLTFGGYDFDFLCEAELPALCKKASAPLQVGKEKYSVVIIPQCLTLRSSTVERLKAFQEAGGTLIFMGAVPAYMDAVASLAPAELAKKANCLPFSKSILFEALAPWREVALYQGERGILTNRYITRLQEHGKERWLFVAAGRLPHRPDIPTADKVRIELKGEYSVKIYDTVSGEILEIPAQYVDGKTVFFHDFYAHDSLLVRFTPKKKKSVLSPMDKSVIEEDFTLPAKVKFTLDTPNALLLDMAEYSFDGGEWQPAEELLRIDNLVREQIDWPMSGGAAAQPWCIEKETSTHRIALRMRIFSDIDCADVMLAAEHPQNTDICLNGKKISNTVIGYFVDKDIRTLALPALKKGENLLELEMPFEKRVPLEWYYLLGNFGVQVTGREKKIIPLAKEIGFESIVHQTLPFYSGVITYEIPVEIKKAGRLSIHIPQYRAAVMELSVDETPIAKPIAFAPYTVETDVLSAGTHTLHLSAYLNRTNAFGAVHNADRVEGWLGPQLWRTTGDRWTYEYELFEEGVLHTPYAKFIPEEI